MTKLVCLLTAAALTATSLASASTANCQADLVNHSLSLPRDLKISEGAAEYLVRSPEHSSLLSSMSRIFLALNHSDLDLNDLGSDLAETQHVLNADERLDLSENDFFKSRLQLISPAVERNLLVLSQTALARTLNSADLGLLAYLWRNTPVNEANQTLRMTLDRQEVMAHLKVKITRLQFLLGNAQLRKAMVALMGDPDGRAYYLKLFSLAQMMNPHMRGYLHPDNLDQMGRELSRGKAMSREGLMIIQQFLAAFAIDISQYANNTMGLRSSSMDGLTMSYHRDDFLQGLAPYFAEKLHLKSQLNSISSLMDHYLFGSSLPWSTQQLHQQALDEAKILLLPLKAEYSEFQGKLNRQLTAEKISAPATPLKLNLIDLFEPKSSPHIRRRFEDKKSAGRQIAGGVEPSIPVVDALRPFTSFATERRNLSELVPLKPYRFWFLRDNEPREQTVRMSVGVCEWIKAHPESGTQLLNALHLGRARTVGQSGLKILNFLISSRYDGSIFELKTSGSVRGLLLYVHGAWELVAVTTKDDLLRAVDSLTPLPQEL